jgi:hypothetical protein
MDSLGRKPRQRTNGGIATTRCWEALCQVRNAIAFAGGETPATMLIM